ncbi:MAG: glycosyltransferase family 9 protein [Candidatus Methylacidiphilales bacterium]|nr:glycosyltransferase family 9 protein [Candidatus Methylacidiphilales bacterium]
MPAPSPSRILIVKPSALGDVVQALPVLTGLKRHWPAAQIDWIVNDSLAGIIEGHPCLHRPVLYQRKQWTKLSALPRVLDFARELRRTRYDLVIDLQGLARSGLMTWATRCPRRIGLRSAREGSRHAYTELIDDTKESSASARYLLALQHLGIEPRPHDFGLTATVPLPFFYTPDKKGVPPIVVHPYSQWRTKLWPWRYFQQLADAAPAQPFVVVGEGPWFPITGQNVTDLRGTLNLRQLIAVLHSASAVLSTDSGPAHLAAALGRPTLALFGATDCRKTKPAGPRVEVITHEVFCSPCLKRHCRNSFPMECMSGLDPLHVLRKLQAMICDDSA